MSAKFDKIDIFIDNYEVLNGQRKEQTLEILQIFVKLFSIVDM